MVHAAKNNHLTISEFMLEKGANNYNWARVRAASNGYLNLVELMMEKGADNYIQALAYAQRNRHEHIVRLTWLLRTYFFNINCALCNICYIL